MILNEENGFWTVRSQHWNNKVPDKWLRGFAYVQFLNSSKFHAHALSQMPQGAARQPQNVKPPHLSPTLHARKTTVQKPSLLMLQQGKSMEGARSKRQKGTCQPLFIQLSCKVQSQQLTNGIGNQIPTSAHSWMLPEEVVLCLQSWPQLHTLPYAPTHLTLTGAKLKKLNHHKASSFYSGEKNLHEDSLARGKRSITTFLAAACH